MDLADGLETGSPFLCLFFPRSSAPSLGSEAHAEERQAPYDEVYTALPPLSESSLLKLSFSEEIDVVCI